MFQESFAKTSLVELIIRQLKVTLPNSETTLTVPIDTIRRGKITLELKREMIQLLWEKGGGKICLNSWSANKRDNTRPIMVFSA
jgi:ketopantoate reductase